MATRVIENVSEGTREKVWMELKISRVSDSSFGQFLFVLDLAYRSLLPLEYCHTFTTLVLSDSCEQKSFQNNSDQLLFRLNIISSRRRRRKQLDCSLARMVSEVDQIPPYKHLLSFSYSPSRKWNHNRCHCVLLLLIRQMTLATDWLWGECRK